MATYPPQDRLIRKEVALGTLREMVPPTTHIGESIAPMMEVASDDVIFDYARELADGLAPARAEDAESELAQKDVMLGGTGRASIMDWALKDHYAASDVARYREALLLAGRLGETGLRDAPLTVATQVQDFNAKVARDEALRKRKLDNRLEWMRMTPLETGGLAYDDGKIKFSVTYGRPSNQQNQAPAGGLWSATTSDPIGDVLAVQQYMYDLYGVRMNRAIASRKVLNSIINSDRFIARAVGIVPGSTANPVDPNYIVNGWGPNYGRQVFSTVCGLDVTEYDAVYRTRAINSTNIVNNRFLNENKIYLLPDPADIAELDDTIGFARCLTSPHPEGNWTPGFYEWEEETRDPWGTTRGTGIKAFPVFMHLDWTYTMTVL